MRKTRVIFISIILLLLAYAIIRYHRTWQDILATMLYPLLVLQKPLVEPIKKLFQWRQISNNLEQELLNTQQLVDSLRAELVAARATAVYYNSIEELVEFKKRYSLQQSIIAQVLLKHFAHDSHFFLLDAGKNKKIQPDMVVVYKNFLVGKITEVYPYYSKALLITDKLCKIAAKCSQSGVRGIHEGNNMLEHTSMAYISHLEKIQLDDLVISTGEGLIFPQGFGIGTIDSFCIKDLQYNIEVKPLVNFEQLSYCTIIQKGTELVPSSDSNSDSTRDNIDSSNSTDSTTAVAVSSSVTDNINNTNNTEIGSEIIGDLT